VVELFFLGFLLDYYFLLTNCPYMKKAIFSTRKLIFRVLTLLTISLSAGFLLLSFSVAKFNEELFKQLGITGDQANRSILYSTLGGHLTYSGVKSLKNFATGDRVKMVQQLAAYSKQYTRTQAFKTEYEKLRNRRKPAEPLPMKTVEAIREEERVRLERGIKQQEINAKSDNPKIRNSVQYALPRMQKELSELNNPDNKVIKQRADQAKAAHERGIKSYNDALQKLEADYPANPDHFIRKRLQEILTMTADVDFDAELRQDKDLKKFVNPVYEKKPAEWKLAFRAGKEATNAVRAEAEKWIREIR
jgi:hypothetical protein